MNTHRVLTDTGRRFGSDVRGDVQRLVGKLAIEGEVGYVRWRDKPWQRSGKSFLIGWFRQSLMNVCYEWHVRLWVILVKVFLGIFFSTQFCTFSVKAGGVTWEAFSCSANCQVSRYTYICTKNDFFSINWLHVWYTKKIDTSAHTILNLPLNLPHFIHKSKVGVCLAFTERSENIARFIAFITFVTHLTK